MYDIDNKTYLFRLHGGGASEKVTLLIESGTRFHTTAFEWPKNVVPSGFSMKLRKHLKNKRLERISQLATDRIVDFQFGTGEAAYHVLLELYDRGNIILTDYEQIILYILRPHTEGESLRFAVREKYPSGRAQVGNIELSEEALREIIEQSNVGEGLKRILMPVLGCGPAVIEHVLIEHGIESCVVGAQQEQTETSKANRCKKNSRSSQISRADTKLFDFATDLPLLMKAIQVGK